MTLDRESVCCEFEYMNFCFWKEKPSLISLILNTKSQKREWLLGVWYNLFRCWLNLLLLNTSWTRMHSSRMRTVCSSHLQGVSAQTLHSRHSSGQTPPWADTPLGRPPWADTPQVGPKHPPARSLNFPLGCVFRHHPCEQNDWQTRVRT